MLPVEDKMSKEVDKRTSLRNQERASVVNTNAYVLNKVKALKKKQSQCGAAHLSYEMKPDRNFVMRLSPAAYEMTKLIVVEELYSNTFYSNFYIESCLNEDECQNQVGSVFRIFNRKKDGTKGNSLKFTINFYHTTSTILANGSKVEIFERELFERICEGVKKQGANLTIVNEQISMALSSIERNASSNNNNIGTRSKLKSIKEKDGNCCTDLSVEIMNGNSDADLGSINTSITQSDTLAQPCDTSERVYQCPSCDQTAGEDTIACEDCGEWFHFTCAGIDRSAAGSIIEEVPYICLLCNDNQLYIDKIVTPKSKSRIEKQNTSDPRHVNENQSTIILDSEHSDLQSQASKTKDSPIYQDISINIERNSDSEKVATVIETNTDNGASDVPLDANKKSKGKKGACNVKKSSNMENQETLIAQKYYISSLEGKVNHLENLLKVMERTVENNSEHKNEPAPTDRCNSQPNRSSCACADQMNYKLLETRLHLLESQNQMWNNLHLQNQLQLQSLVRERLAPYYPQPMAPVFHQTNPTMGPFIVSAPPGHIPLTQPYPVQMPFMNFATPAYIPGNIPQNIVPPNVQGRYMVPTVVPNPTQPQASTSRNDITDTVNAHIQRQQQTGSDKMHRRGLGTSNSHKPRSRNHVNHRQNNVGQKRQFHSDSVVNQPTVQPQCGDEKESANCVVEHGCSTAAVSSHELPSHSTSDANEMPRGGPENAHELFEGILSKENHPASCDTVGSRSEVHDGPIEYLNLNHSQIKSPSRNGNRKQEVLQNVPEQQNFLRIPSLKSVPPDMDSLEADLSWEMITTRL